MTDFPFSPGDPVPWFSCRSSRNPHFKFDTSAGQYIVLSFIGSAGQGVGAHMAQFARSELRPYFDDKKIICFLVSVDPADERENRLPDLLPGIRSFWDDGRRVSRQFGALQPGVAGSPAIYRPYTLVLDPAMRVIAAIATRDLAAHHAQLRHVLDSLPPLDDYAAVPLHAPVLIVPRVFEPEFCRELIACYQRDGGHDSGFMRERDGHTVAMLDPHFKRRRDFNFETGPAYEPLRAAIRQRLVTRLLPEIRKAYQYEATRIERYVVACYEGAQGGFFYRHRDNTTKGTAHRRFACTINLNAEEFTGGELRFPEYGSRSYRAPTGGAVVFSCALLHEALPVTHGTRYAFLPFFYDEETAKIRSENSRYIISDLTDEPRLPPAD